MKREILAEILFQEETHRNGGGEIGRMWSVAIDEDIRMI